MNFSFFPRLAASRTRSSACDTLSRSCARRVLCWFAFPLVPVLGSTNSAADCSVLFADFTATRPSDREAVRNGHGVFVQNASRRSLGNRVFPGRFLILADRRNVKAATVARMRLSQVTEKPDLAIDGRSAQLRGHWALNDDRSPIHSTMRCRRGHHCRR